MSSLRADDGGPEDFMGVFENCVFGDIVANRAMQVTPGKAWVSNVRSTREPRDSRRVYVCEPDVAGVDELAEAAGVAPSDVLAEMFEMLKERLFGPHAEPGLKETLILRLAPRALEAAQKRREAEHQRVRMEQEMQRLRHDAAMQAVRQAHVQSVLGDARVVVVARPEPRPAGLWNRLFNWNG